MQTKRRARPLEPTKDGGGSAAFGSSAGKQPALPTQVRRIVLTGFMGAGKTSVGRALARVLEWRFLDLDDAICAEASLSVPEIFDAHGEAHFRELEGRALVRALDGDHVVVALGGGALESDEAYRAVRSVPDTALVFLHAPLPELLQRCERHGGAAGRPLLRDRTEAETRYKKRLPRYENAHLRVETSGSLAYETALRIQQAFSQSLP